MKTANYARGQGAQKNRGRPPGKEGDHSSGLSIMLFCAGHY